MDALSATDPNEQAHTCALLGTSDISLGHTESSRHDASILHFSNVTHQYPPSVISEDSAGIYLYQDMEAFVMDDTMRQWTYDEWHEDLRRRRCLEQGTVYLPSLWAAASQTSYTIPLAAMMAHTPARLLPPRYSTVTTNHFDCQKLPHRIHMSDDASESDGTGSSPSSRTNSSAPTTPSPSLTAANHIVSHQVHLLEFAQRFPGLRENRSTPELDSPTNSTEYARGAKRKAGGAGDPRSESMPTNGGYASLPASRAPKAQKAQYLKPSVACLFCRQRKIACRAPPPEVSDRTCSQCQSRQRVCEYPRQSFRGSRKQRPLELTQESDQPQDVRPPPGSVSS